MPLNELLKDIYFHDLNARDNIFTRLQLNFAAYVTTFTVMAYMARMIDYSSPCWAVTLFYSGLLLGLVPLILSIRYTIIAFTGYTYTLFPSAILSVEYKVGIASYYKALENQGNESRPGQSTDKSDKVLDEYISDSLAQCIDKNNKVNEQRRLINRKSLLQLLYAFVPLTISACLFIFVDLDASSPRKNLLKVDSGLRESITQPNNGSTESINAIIRELSKMSDEKKPQSNQQQPITQPALPALPQRPPLQYSTEDFKAPLPDKSKLLTEGK